jgi:hypothetical protein
MSETAAKSKSWLVLFAILFAAASIICYQAYQPHMTMWANDSHLGALEESSRHLPSAFLGEWDDMWWIGSPIPTPSPTVTLTLATFISPEMYLKIYAAFTMFVLGFSAWVLFRQLKFAPMVCVLGGLAAGLNTHCFSNACWGTGTWNISIAMLFLGVAAIVTDNIRQTWIKAVLAGLAAGMGVMEGFDSGAILSIYLGIFVFFFCWISQTTLAERITRGIGMGIVVVLCAVWIATSTVATLVGTQIQGVADSGDTPQAKFDFATQWSLPKMESLRVIIPGLYGYRIQQYTTPPPPALAFLMPFPSDRAGVLEGMVDPAPSYWGKVGEEPHLARMESSNPEVRGEAIAALAGGAQEVIDVMRGNNKTERAQIIEEVESQMPANALRFSGNGEYAGVITALFAIFAIVNCCRGEASPYSRRERQMAWFWGGAALFALVAAWGRFAPLYSFLFHLPGIDKIRNPIKFMHPFTVAWIILAGFGMEAFARLYTRSAVKTTSAAKILEDKNGWQRLSGFDKKYLTGLIVALVGIFLGYLLYAGFRPDLVKYLIYHRFDPEAAGRIAAFSVREVAWFVIITVLASAVIISAMRGWSAAGARWGWGILCFIMVFDMARADVPWVRYFDAGKSYSMNDITKFLMDKPYEHRVTGRLRPNGGYDLPGSNQDFAAAIYWWVENDFPAHNIQSVEIDQMPRAPVMDVNYLNHFIPRGNDLTPAARLWKLTNTRYVFASANLLPTLNQVASPGRNAFHYVKRFNFETKPDVAIRRDAGDIQPVMSESGSDALIEYTDALPRAKLYAHWLTPDNDDAALQMLSNPEWNPDESVLVSKSTNGAALPASSTDPKADPGTVQITHYSAKDKDIQLQANNPKTPTVLLYNDRTGAGWNVSVDGKPSELLRCNYIMRGVFLPPGEHTVEFKFAPSLVPLCITLAALLFGIALLFYVCWPRPGATLAAPSA